MVVTALEQLTRKKTKLYLDEDLKGILYPQEIRRYHIVQGAELSESQWETLYQEVILRRAKQKAMTLLVRMDYSEYGMRCKLQREYYCEQAIEDTISFLYSYHYLDDVRYAQQFMISRGGSMGRTEIRRKLRAQGIRDDIIVQVYEEAGLEDMDILHEQMKKRLAGRTQLDDKEQRKIISYFLRRGFPYTKIAAVMRCYVKNECSDMWEFSDDIHSI